MKLEFDPDTPTIGFGDERMVPDKKALEAEVELLAAALFRGVKIIGFDGPEEEMVRAQMSRVPPELLSNVKQVVATPSLQPKHGSFIPATKTIELNPFIFKLRQRFGQGQGWIWHHDLTLLHEIGHSVYTSLSEAEKDQWRDISGWMIGWREGQSPAYEEKRPGWPHGSSSWTHKPGVRFTRKYAEKNDNEDFADSFAFFMLNKPHQMAPEKRDFMQYVVQQRVQKYPKALIEGPSKAYGERGN